MTSLIIEAVIEENSGLNEIVLSKKYLDFLNIFDKAWADILS